MPSDPPDRSIEMPEMNIEGEIRDRSHRDGGHQGGARGDRDRPDNRRSGRGRSSGPATISVKINGRTLKVSAKLAAEIAEFRTELQDMNGVGAMGAAVAAFAGLLGIVSAPSSVATTSVNEVETLLSASHSWNQMTRQRARTSADQARARAEGRGHRADAEVWRQLSEMLREPKRLLDGGLKQERDKTIKIRPMSGREETRPGPALHLETQDRIELAMLLAHLTALSPVCTAYIMLTDFAGYGAATESSSLDARDVALINKCLLKSPDSEKNALMLRLQGVGRNPRCLMSTWLEFDRFLISDQRAWREMMSDRGTWVDTLVM